MRTQISLLADRPDLAPVVAGWFEAQWPDYFGAKPLGHALAMLSARMNRDRLPLCLVAFDGAAPIGTASLAASSIDEFPDIGPWIVGHLVLPEHRRRGVGMALAGRALSIAGELGYRGVYIAIRRGQEAFERQGWLVHARVQHDGEPIVVLRKDLAPCR